MNFIVGTDNDDGCGKYSELILIGSSAWFILTLTRYSTNNYLTLYILRYDARLVCLVGSASAL
jgi:hypothetical protein